MAPKLAGKEGRGFVKVLLNELEGALESAVDKIEDAKKETSPCAPDDSEPPAPA